VLGVVAFLHRLAYCMFATFGTYCAAVLQGLLKGHTFCASMLCCRRPLPIADIILECVTRVCNKRNRMSAS
jgi:hypothetical protein